MAIACIAQPAQASPAQTTVTFELHTSLPGYETISTHDVAMDLVDRQMVDQPGDRNDRLRAAGWALGNLYHAMDLTAVPPLDAARLLALLEASPTGCAQIACIAGVPPSHTAPRA